MVSASITAFTYGSQQCHVILPRAFGAEEDHASLIESLDSILAALTQIDLCTNTLGRWLLELQAPLEIYALHNEVADCTIILQ